MFILPTFIIVRHLLNPLYFINIRKVLEWLVAAAERDTPHIEKGHIHILCTHTHANAIPRAPLKFDPNYRPGLSSLFIGFGGKVTCVALE